MARAPKHLACLSATPTRPGHWHAAYTRSTGTLRKVGYLCSRCRRFISTDEARVHPDFASTRDRRHLLAQRRRAEQFEQEQRAALADQHFHDDVAAWGDELGDDD